MNGNIPVDTLSSSDFRMQHFTIRELLERMDNNQLLCSRVKGKEWSKQKQVQFIESILTGIPVSSFYFNGSKPLWEVLDGVERLYAIEQYVENKLCLSFLELLPPAYNGYFGALPPFVRRRFLNTPILGYVLTTHISNEILNSIYRRLNNHSEND